MARSPRRKSWCERTRASSWRSSSATTPILMLITQPPVPSWRASSNVSTRLAGVGTGGTISGVGHYLREHFGGRPLIVAVEPKNSPVLAGGEAGFHKIQGIGAGFIPENLDTKVYDEIIAVSDEEATLHSRRLAREEGLLVGISSGAACCAALRVAKRLGR